LHQRIDARVEQMFAAGLVEEVRGLLAKHGTLSRTAMQAVGYREVIDFLQSRDQWSRDQRAEDRGQEPGDRSQESGIDSLSLSPSLPPSISPSLLLLHVKTRTHRFARRQETWFRGLSECTLVPMQTGAEPAAVAEAIARQREAAI
jgi:tRNA dimethylallyltransferase